METPPVPREHLTSEDNPVRPASLVRPAVTPSVVAAEVPASVSMNVNPNINPNDLSMEPSADASDSQSLVVQPPVCSSSVHAARNCTGPDPMDIDEENLGDTLQAEFTHSGLRRVNKQDSIIPNFSPQEGPLASIAQRRFDIAKDVVVPLLNIQENVTDATLQPQGGSSATSPVTPSTSTVFPANQRFVQDAFVGQSEQNRDLRLEGPAIPYPHIPVAGGSAAPMQVSASDSSRSTIVNRDNVTVDAFDSATEEFMIDELSNFGADSNTDQNSAVLLASHAAPRTLAADRMYLDILPVEILDNILRQISSRPRQTRWERDIDVNDLRLLLCGSGAMADVAKRKLTGLRISNKYLSSDYLPMAHWNNHLPEILCATGANLAKVRLMIDPHDVAPWDDAWVHSIAKHCTALTHLSVSGLSEDALFEQLLASRSGQLKTLDVDCRYSKPRITSIEHHGAGLRKLVVTRPAGDFTNAMRVVGRTLTEIEFTLGLPAMSFDILFTALKLHCREMRQLKFRGVNRGALPSLADLCVSYGAQLKRVSLPAIMTPELMRKVAEECPNVRVKLRCAAGNVVHCGRALGARLAILNFTLHLQRPMQHEFQNEVLPGLISELAHYAGDWRNLDTLTVKELCASGADVMQALLEEPKKRLTSLEVGLANEDETDLMKVLTQYTGGLRTFTFTGFLPKEKAFRAFAHANPKLGKVKIRIKGGRRGPTGREFIPENCGSIFVDIIESFASCRELRAITISGIDGRYDSLNAIALASVADACCKLRRRNVRIQVCGVHYLA